MEAGEALAAWHGRGRRLVPRRLRARRQSRDVARRGPGPRRGAVARPARARPPSPSPAPCAAAWRRLASRSPSGPATAASASGWRRVLPGAAGRRPAAPPSVAIVGGGIAGAALARAFAALGVAAGLVEAEALGAGASGNPAALVTPRLDAGGGAGARLHAQAFARAVALYRRETPEAVIAEGALQLEAAERDGRRFDTVAQSDLFEPGAVQRLSAFRGVGAARGAARRGGLWLADALIVEPARGDRALDCGRRGHRGRGRRDRPGRRRLAAARRRGRGDRHGRGRLPRGGARGGGPVGPAAAPDPRPGELGRAASRAAAAAAWGGYLAPDAHRPAVRRHPRPRRHRRRGQGRRTTRRNLATLAARRPALAAASGRHARSTAAPRCARRGRTSRRWPARSPGRPGLFVLAGLGGRGFTLAPLLAEHVAALALGAPSPLPAPLAARLDPDHFRRSASGCRIVGRPAPPDKDRAMTASLPPHPRRRRRPVRPGRRRAGLGPDRRPPGRGRQAGQAVLLRAQHQRLERGRRPLRRSCRRGRRPLPGQAVRRPARSCAGPEVIGVRNRGSDWVCTGDTFDLFVRDSARPAPRHCPVEFDDVDHPGGGGGADEEEEALTRHTALPTSSATSRAPERSTATPTGRPQAFSSGDEEAGEHVARRALGPAAGEGHEDHLVAVGAWSGSTSRAGR